MTRLDREALAALLVLAALWALGQVLVGEPALILEQQHHGSVDGRPYPTPPWP